MKNIITKIKALIVITVLFAVTTAKAQTSGNWGFERHNNLPFECTFHYINIGNGEFLILDVIRSKENSIRFFHFSTSTGLIEHKIDKGNFYLAQDENRLIGQSDELNFDVYFDVDHSGVPVPAVNPFNVFDITALDHSASRYEGWVAFNDNFWSLNKGVNTGTISQHFGRKLPAYFYFNTLPDNSSDDHLVGAFVLVSTRYGWEIESYYVLETSGGVSELLTLYNSVQTCERIADGEWKIKVKTWKDEYELNIKAGTDLNNILPHMIDGKMGIDFFGSTIESTKHNRTFPALVEWRAFHDERFISTDFESFGGSAVAGVSNKFKSDNNMQVYPSPAADLTTVSLNIENETKVVLEVVDAKGQLVQSHDLGKVAKGDVKKQLNVSALAEGLYFVNEKANGVTVQSNRLQVVR